MPLLLLLGLVLTAFGGYGYLGHYYVRCGGTVGDGGSVYTLAWPIFMKSAPWTLGLGLPCLAAAAIWALAT